MEIIMTGKIDPVQLKLLTVATLEQMNYDMAAEVADLKENQKLVQFELGQRSRLEKFHEMTKVLSNDEKAQLMQVLGSQGISSGEAIGRAVQG